MAYRNVERSLIDYISGRAVSADGIPGLGIGDDAAFLLLSSMEEGKLIITTDSVVENVHYKKEWCSYADVAVKLFERSSSDILAKGGHPHWALLNMNITPEFSRDKSMYTSFLDTLTDKLKEHHVALIGGDITRSAVNSFTLTVLGNASVFIRRKNPEVQKGDLVVVYGKVGGSSYALDRLSQGKSPDDQETLFYRRPEACWQNAWLKDLGAKVSIDQSDSVFETFDIMAKDNKIELTIALETIPLHTSLQNGLQKTLALNLWEESAGAILKSAEDLAIMAIIPAAHINRVAGVENLHVVGVVSDVNAENVVYQWYKKNIEINKIPGLFEHFQE